MSFTQTTLGSDNTSGSATTIVVTGITASAGDFICGAAAWNASGVGEACAFSDSVNGSWGSFNGLGNSDLQVTVAQIGAALTLFQLPSALSSGSITATLPGSRSGRIICAWKVPAAEMNVPKTNDTTGSSASSTSTTAAPSSKTPLFNPDFDVLIVGAANSTTLSTPAGYTQMFDLQEVIVGIRLAAYGVTDPTINNTARNPSVTLGTSQKWVAAQAFYKAFVAAAGGARNLASTGCGT